MRRSRLLFAVLAFTALALCASQGAATAAPKTAAAGSITVVSNTVDSTKQAGGNTTVHATAIVDFAGTLTGRATEVYTSTTHANGRANQHGTGVFTGTVGGRTGTIDYVFHGDATGGVISITGGTGGLRGAHGKIAYRLATTSPTAVFDYSGAVFFT